MLERLHLSILREIKRSGTLTEAAASLNLTQSALSHSIKKLEQDFGVRLWEKDGRRLRFTEAGSYLLNVANRLLPQMDHAERILEQFASGQRGILRIGIECHPCSLWLTRIVSPFLNRWPDVDVDIREEYRFGGMGALIGHDIDLLITPDPLKKSGLIFEPVFDFEMVLVVPEKHPLADRKFVRPQQLSEEILLTYPVENDRLDIMTMFFVPSQCRPKKHKYIENTEMLLQMVAAGRGVTALPKWFVDEYQGAFQIRSIRLGEKGLYKQLFIGRRKKAQIEEYITGFISMAREAGTMITAPNIRHTPRPIDSSSLLP